MAATFRSASANNNGAGTGASYAVTLPTGWAAGDLVLVAVGVAATTTFNTLSGWQLDRSDQNAGATVHTAGVYYRVMQAGDSNPTFTSAAGGKAAWTAISIQPGAGETIFIDYSDAPLISTTASTGVTAPSRAGGVVCSVLLYTARANVDGATAINVTPPTSWTEGADSSTATGTTTALRQMEAESCYRDGQSGTVAPGANTTNVSTLQNAYHYIVGATAAITSLGVFQDNFDDNSVDATKWPFSFGTFSEVGGRARVQCNTTGSAYVSNLLYQLKDTALSAQLFPASGANATSQAYSYIYVTSHIGGTHLQFGRVQNSGVDNLYMGSMTNYADSTAVTVTYSAVNHAWVRLREQAGTVYYETAPDGKAWTVQRSISSPTWVTFTNLYVYLITQRNDGTVDNFEVDNFNVLPNTAKGVILSQAVTRSYFY